jgi:hypothetical protein
VFYGYNLYSIYGKLSIWDFLLVLPILTASGGGGLVRYGYPKAAGEAALNQRFVQWSPIEKGAALGVNYTLHSTVLPLSR